MCNLNRPEDSNFASEKSSIFKGIFGLERKKGFSDFPSQAYIENLLKQGVLNSEDVKNTPGYLLLSWGGNKIVSHMQPNPLICCFSEVQSGMCSLTSLVYLQ